MSATDNQTSAPSYASQLVMQELAERLASQVDSAHCEIGETRAILKDAVDRLMPAFTAARSNEAAPHIPEQMELGSIRSGRADRASGPAFSALQFQDISDQLLAHAQLRLSALLAEVNDIAAALAPGPSGHLEADAIMRMIASANDNLATLDVSLVKPVGKAHLGTGDIDLF